MKKFLKITFGILLILVIALYLGIVFLLPPAVNSKTTINKLESLILKKTGTEAVITGLNLKISPKLTVALNLDSLEAKNNNVSVADIRKLSLQYKVLQKHLTLVSAENIFIDGNYLKQFKKEKKEKKKKNFNLKKKPEIHISSLVFKSDKVNLNVSNLETENDYIKLKAAIDTPFLGDTLKLGESGSLQVVENKLKANQFKVTLGNSHLYLDGILAGENKAVDFKIKGESLPASEIMATILHMQKAKEKERKFIENFRNFKGTADVDLKVDKDGFWGTCTAHNLGATAWFDIPLFFKEAVFTFKGRQVVSVAEGLLGRGKVVHTLDITEMGTPQKEVVGKMYTTLTKNFDYIPNLTVLNSVDTSLVYRIKNKKPDVVYNIDIPVKSDLIYNSFFLGLRDYKRKISANTLKDGSNLHLKTFKYAYYDSGKENVILAGDALFIKNIDKADPDRFVPQYLTVRTNGYAPTSVIGAFGEKVRGGKFKGDLKYDFKNNQVLGTFDIIESRHKAFRIDNAHIIAKNGVLNITSDGLYKGEKYTAELNAKNNIFGETLIYDMKLFLDKLVLKTTADEHKKKRKGPPIDFSKKVKDSALTINNWEIVINEITRDKFVLNNVKLVGSLKKHIFDFNMKEMNFADGTINASGFYDFAKNTSKMTFSGENINSNKVAEMTLNLQNQVEGIAKAKVDIDSKDMFRFLDAHCVFEVKEGFLPRLGDKEFMIKDTKYKLSEITNLDWSHKDFMKDDIIGSFDVHNSEIQNIDLTTWHKLSAMYLEGNYEMEKQIADLQLFWHYSKEAPRGIKVFCVPLSWILKVVFKPEHTKDLYQPKLSKIPGINAEEKNTTYYRIHLKGNINQGKTELELKEIR